MAAKKKAVPNTIFSRLVTTMLLVSVFPVLGLWLVDYRSIQNELGDNLVEVLDRTTDSIAVKIDDWTDTNVRVLRQAAIMDDTISMVEWRQLPILKAIGQTYEWTYLVYAVGMDGYKTARNDDVPIFNPDGTKAHYRGDRAYFTQVINGQPVGSQVLMSRTHNKPALILTVPIKASETEMVGVLALGTILTDLSNAVADTRIGQTGFAFLVDGQGRVIAHGRPEQVSEELQDFSGHPGLTTKPGDRGLVEYFDTGRDVIAVRRPVGLDWTLVVQQDRAEAFAELEAVKQRGIAILVGGILVVLVLAVLLARGLSRPIHKLTEIADAYSQGKLDLKVPETERDDEIGALARSVERLGISIKMAMERLRSPASRPASKPPAPNKPK